MNVEELQKQAKEYREKYEEESDQEFVLVQEKGQRGKSLNRIIDEGVFNIQDQSKSRQNVDENRFPVSVVHINETVQS